MGCMERYAAKDRARMKVMLAPWEALAMAVRMKRLLKAEVDRAIHVAIVKGLRRKLYMISLWMATWSVLLTLPQLPDWSTLNLSSRM